MIIEMPIKIRIELFAEGKYVKGSKEPASYDLIEDLKLFLGDIEITDRLSISELLRIEEELIDQIVSSQRNG